MYIESKRVFISDLPEELTSGDVTKRFSEYGSVSSVEIKERKDLGSKNNSRFFAFVNIEIDVGSLQKCFQEISREKWNGQYVQLQLARENFLDRLKKEREEAKQSQPSPSTIAEPLPLINFNTQKNLEHPIIIKSRANEAIQSNTDSSDSEDENHSISQLNEHSNGVVDTEKKEECVKLADIVYKSNKSKIVNNKLVIDSVGNKPIFISTAIKSKSLDPKRTEADQKRKQSLLEKRQGFNKQKFLIKSALAKIDVASSVTDNSDVSINNASKTHSKSSKKPMLFENDDLDDEAFNFNLKKQYEGAEGQRLLALQSNYKNDTRFTLDERFIEEERFDEVENDLLGEKKQEYAIMEEVLGINVAPNIERQNNKLMLRFDPNQPEHSKYEIKDNLEPIKATKKRKKVEVVLPEVSQETFFNVDGTALKDALQEKSSFSLLGMFGETSKTTVQDNIEPSIKLQKKNSLLHTQNPFKYDSSDDEYQGETENIANKDSRKKTKETSATVSLGTKRLWTESLFFKEDDYRFQDGMEFVMKLGTEETGGISEVRQQIKQIVRAKVRNNKGKDKMFKKKLGGQKFKLRKGQKRH